MRKIGFIIGLTCLLLSACTGTKTVARGLENESFLVLVGDTKKYADGVDVDIDEKIVFRAEIVKDYTKIPKGKHYAIAPGRHIVTVSHQNNVISKKQIFISAQETKKIILP